MIGMKMNHGITYKWLIEILLKGKFDFHSNEQFILIPTLKNQSKHIQRN